MRVFKRRTVEEITRPITKIVTELERHAASNFETAEIHSTVAQTHMTYSANAKAEAERAQAAGAKIASLLG